MIQVEMDAFQAAVYIGVDNRQAYLKNGALPGMRIPSSMRSVDFSAQTMC
jgi:hypothetical protein